MGLTDLAGIPDGDGVAECSGETAEELAGEAEEDGDGGGLWECGTDSGDQRTSCLHGVVKPLTGVNALATPVNADFGGL